MCLVIVIVIVIQIKTSQDLELCWYTKSVTMSLLSVVCQEMGLETDTSSLDDKQCLPQKWNDFISMKDDELKQCKEIILQKLNIDSNTVDTLWFNMNYLSLYHHFNIVKLLFNSSTKIESFVI